MWLGRGKTMIKVLLVDDEPTFLKQAKEFLEKENERLDIVISFSAKEGLKVLEEPNIDIIVSDFKMPEMNGLDFLKKIREDNRSDLPFIILTGRGREDVAMEALNLGADRYLQKGGDPRTLYGLLEDAIIQAYDSYERDKELEKRKERLNAVLDASKEVIFTKDKTGRYTEVNNTFCELFGLDKEKLLGKTEEDLFSRKEAEELRRDDEKVLESEESYSTIHPLSVDDESRVFDITKVPLKDDEGKIIGVCGFAEDITEERETEKKLKFESSLLNSLLKNVPDSVYFKDKEARFIRVSKSKAEHLNTTREKIIGKTDFDFYPEDEAQEMFEDDMKVMEEEEPIVDKVENITRPGEEERWVSTTKVPRYNEQGEVVGMLGISRDITERREAEKRQEFLHTLLRHDIKNKITVIEGYLDLIEDIGLSEEHEKYVSKALKVTKESSDLIEKIRTLRKVGAENLKKVNLGPMIDAVVSDIEPKASDEEITIDYEICDCEVMADPLLEEAVSNVLENSIEHSNCDKIVIRVEELPDELIISVRDDGRGIDEENKEKVMERGFTASDSTGSGLGLFLVKTIVESYDGKVEIKDSEMGGARFDIHLEKV